MIRLFLHHFVTCIWPFLPTYCFSSLPLFLFRFIFLKWSHLTKSTAPVPRRVVTMFFLFFFNGTLNGRSTTQGQYLKCDIAQFPASWYDCRSYCICDCKGIWEPQHPWAAGVTLVWSGNQGRAGVLGTLSRRTLRQAALAIGTFVEPGQGHSWKPLVEIGALKWWKKKIH